MTSTDEEATTNRVSRSIDAAAKPPQRFRHTQAALDRLSIRRLIANEPIDVDDVLAGLERDSRETGTMKEIVEELHGRSLDDRQFSIKLSALARPDMIKPRDELNVTGLQIILIRIIQGTYEGRDQLRTSSRKRYRNALSLSGEFYHRYCATDASFFCLNAHLIAWLADLLRDTEEEDVELVARQLSINGQLLLRRAERKLNELVRQVKQHLVHRNLSVKSRTLLLYVVDLANRDFAPLSGEQRDFYARQLGEATFADFEFCGRHVIDDDRVISQQQQQQQQQQTTCSRSVLVARHPQSHFKPVRSDRLPMKPRTRYDPSKPIVVPRPNTTTTTTTTSSEDSFDRFAKSKSDALPQTSRRDRWTQAAAAHHRRSDQRSGQLYDHKAERSKQQQQHQRGRICKSFNKDRKPIRHPPPLAPRQQQQQQQQLDRDRSLPSSNGGISKNNARDETTTATTTTTEADDEDDAGISFKLDSWADDLPDEEDDEFVETPEWYKKSSNESFSSGKETKAGDSLTRNTSNMTSDSSNSGHRRLPVPKPKRYSERKSRRG